MLADAIRAEGYRLVRNRTTMFWGVLFIPLVVAVGGTLINWFMKVQGDRAMAAAGITDLPEGLGREPLNLAEGIIGGAALGANGAVLVFSLIVAAALYAGDYRWETWRLISARNTRLNLIVGKVATLGVVALIGLVLFQVGILIFGLSQAVITGRPLSFQIEAAQLGDAGLLALLSWLRIIQYAMLALLTAVLTRSLLAALFIPFVVGFGQSLLGSIGLPFLQRDASDWQSLLLMPGAAFDILKAAVSPEGNPLAMAFTPEGAPPPPAPARGEVIKAATSLALWTLVPFVAAIAWFQRQDLSKE